MEGSCVKYRTVGCQPANSFVGHRAEVAFANENKETFKKKLLKLIFSVLSVAVCLVNARGLLSKILVRIFFNPVFSITIFLL